MKGIYEQNSSWTLNKYNWIIWINMKGNNGTAVDFTFDVHTLKIRLAICLSYIEKYNEFCNKQTWTILLFCQDERQGDT